MINVYVIQILLILFFGFLFREDKKKFLTVAFIVLFVVMAFRDARLVGNDSATSYYIEFLGIKQAKLSWPNPGLPMVMKAVRHFTGDYQWVIIITAVWVCFAYYRLLIKHSENGFISVMWFMGMLFYTFLFSALKQAWAMAFLCYAFDAIVEKKPIRFLLLVGLAVVFHFPALVFLPAFWIAKLKINWTFPILMAGVLGVVFIFRAQLLDMMTSTYAKGTVNYSVALQYTGTKFVFMVLMLAYGFYQYFVYYKPAGVKAGIKTHQLSMLLYFMGIAAAIQTFCLHSNNFERLADYYYQFSILFVPLILLKNNYAAGSHDNTDAFPASGNRGSSGALAKTRIGHYSIENIDVNIALTIIISAFCMWRFISVTGSGADSLTPFYFFWQ